MFKSRLLLLSILLVSNLKLYSQYLNITSSNLPIIVIDTDSVVIRDEPKIDAHMGIIWNEFDDENLTSDTFNHYEGKIAIEIRGSSSQMFDKKSYGFELRDESGLDMDTTLLGMPAEEDWILNGPYMDKSLIRNVLTFTLGASLGHYTPRCRYVELIINKEYKGLYVLMEKIKRDKNRVDIAKLKTDDIEGEELSGGYIIKIDKTTGSGGDGFSSEYINESNTKTFYQYHYPKQEEIRPEQKDYISEYVRAFEKSVYENDFSSVTGYRKYIDVPSFVDFQIMNEMARNVDGYRLSTFFYKDKNEKLNIGPLWDFNLTYGNANYYDAWNEAGLQISVSNEGDYWGNPFYWEEMRKDPYYCSQVVERWNDLRLNELSDERVFFVIDSLTNLISSASERNFMKWDILDQWVWPNYFVGPTWESEIEWMTEWLDKRMQWMDKNIANYFKVEDDKIDLPPGEEVNIGPNPFIDKLTFFVKLDYRFPVRLDVFNGKGALVSSKVILMEVGINEYDYPHSQEIEPGIYFYRMIKGKNILSSGKIVKIK